MHGLFMNAGLEGQKMQLTDRELGEQAAHWESVAGICDTLGAQPPRG